jgi:hypothetical protein
MFILIGWVTKECQEMVTARMEGTRKGGRPGEIWTTRLQEFEDNGNNRLTCSGQIWEGIG